MEDDKERVLGASKCEQVGNRGLDNANISGRRREYILLWLRKNTKSRTVDEAAIEDSMSDIPKRA